MSAIIPFDFAAPAATGARQRENNINASVIMGGAGYPVLSIKGKVFAIVKDSERKPLIRRMKDEEDNVVDVPVAALQLAVVRANSKGRVFYAKSFVDGEDNQKPTCFSHDGLRPDASVDEPQAGNCQLCPHAQWGTKTSSDGAAVKGTACTVRTRLAVTDPKDPKLTTYLLNVPAGSRASFSDAVKTADSHGKNYNEVVMKISFDNEAPSPKLVFQPCGLVSDEVYEKISGLFEDKTVLDIIGTPTLRQVEEVARPAAALAAPDTPRALPAQEVTDVVAKTIAKAKAPVVTETEVEGALFGSGEPAPAATKPAAKPRAVAKPKPATVAVDTEPSAAGGLLDELQSVLGMTDD